MKKNIKEGIEIAEKYAARLLQDRYNMCHYVYNEDSYLPAPAVAFCISEKDYNNLKFVKSIKLDSNARYETHTYAGAYYLRITVFSMDDK